MSIESQPPAFESSSPPYEIPLTTVNRTAAGLAAYVFLVLYPAYGLLRLLWVDGAAVFTWVSTGIAFVTAVLFGLFARRLIWRYVRIGRRVAGSE